MDNKTKRQAYMKEWMLKNKKRIASYNKEWYKNNKDKVAEYHAIWLENNKEAQNEYHVNYYRNSKQRRLAHSHLSNLRKIIKGVRSGKFYLPSVIGVKNRDEFLDILGRDKVTMYGRGMDSYCLDHISALSNFDLTKDCERVKAFNISNIHLITNRDNYSKSYPKK
jgi:hypothetical protein